MALLFCTFSLQAEDNNVLQIRTIAIPPYGIVSESRLSGIYYDIANTLASEAGFNISHQIYPYSRIIRELKSGHTDLTIMFKYKELKDYVTYIAPLPGLKNVVIGIAGSSFSDVASLKGKKLGYLRGAKFSDLIDNDPDIIKVETIDFSQGIKMLDARRIDAVIGPFDPILMAAKSLGYSPLFFGKPLVVSKRTPWVQISKKSESRVSVEDLKSHFLELLKRGDLERLRKKYISSSTSK